MRKAVFEQLTENIRRDGYLSSVPLCQELEGGDLEVLSGNHRVQAAIAAGVEQILVIVIPENASPRKIAIQLSHNSLTGEDDRRTRRRVGDATVGRSEVEWLVEDGDMAHRLHPTSRPVRCRPTLRTIVGFFS